MIIKKFKHYILYAKCKRIAYKTRLDESTRKKTRRHCEHLLNTPIAKSYLSDKRPKLFSFKSKFGRKFVDKFTSTREGQNLRMMVTKEFSIVSNARTYTRLIGY